MSVDPDVRFGEPCINGTSADVMTVIGAIAAGDSLEMVAD
ncbi:MAG: DUF433 domain-containing protein [Actinomycetota bacterium]